MKGGHHEADREQTMFMNVPQAMLSVFQSNIAKSSKSGFCCRESSHRDGHGIRNSDKTEANKSGSCWGGKFATHQNSSKLQFNKRKSLSFA